MAAENCLWGAPRIHGELLKLGIAISERTVSRYLCGRPSTRSQTWRTFLANHLGGQTFISPTVMFAHAHDEDTVVDASDVSCCPTLLSASVQGPSVDFGRSLQSPFLVVHLGHDHLQDNTDGRMRPGRDPPPHLPLQPASRQPYRCSFMRAEKAVVTDGV